MADKAETVVNAGDQITTPPSALPLKPDEQFRLINQRLDKLAGDFDKIAKPPTFRIADIVQVLAIVVGLVITGIAAFGLSERISDLSVHQADSERRLDATMNATEIRLGAKVEKLSDQFMSMDERTSRLEGEKSPKLEKASDHRK
jgi:hypothetical protein